MKTEYRQQREGCSRNKQAPAKGKSTLTVFYFVFPSPFTFLVFFFPFSLIPFLLQKDVILWSHFRPLLIMGKQQLYSYYTLNEKEKQG